MSSEVRALGHVPSTTLEWLLTEDNPAVAVLTRRRLLREEESERAQALWARRNSYAPVAAILDAMRDDGTWTTPGRDYQKYGGNMWQIHFLGELWADPTDARIDRATEYAFSRQLPDGSWSVNGRPNGAIPCLTANVGRALARLGYASDERIVRALDWIGDPVRGSQPLNCVGGADVYTLNGYCHMLAPKVLLFLAEVPRGLWPASAERLLRASVEALRDKQVFRCLPKQSREFTDRIWSAAPADRPHVRANFLADAGPLVYGDKPGWLRFGYPLSYNSDALESLAALAGVGEELRDEYVSALNLVKKTADPQMRWLLKNSLNGKMLADVETKGQPSKWLTLRALTVLDHFGALTS